QLIVVAGEDQAIVGVEEAQREALGIHNGIFEQPPATVAVALEVVGLKGVAIEGAPLCAHRPGCQASAELREALGRLVEQLFEARHATLASTARGWIEALARADQVGSARPRCAPDRAAAQAEPEVVVPVPLCYHADNRRHFGGPTSVLQPSWMSTLALASSRTRSQSSPHRMILVCSAFHCQPSTHGLLGSCSTFSGVPLPFGV